MQAKSQVTRVPAANTDDAIAHFEKRLTFETDCWDVHHDIEHSVGDFVVLDVRSPALFLEGHVPTSESLPHPKISEGTLPPLPSGGIYVVYCAGPHCNGANKAAIKIAKLGLPVKEMTGGVEGWKDEEFSLATGAA